MPVIPTSNNGENYQERAVKNASYYMDLNENNQNNENIQHNPTKIRDSEGVTEGRILTKKKAKIPQINVETKKV